MNIRVFAVGSPSDLVLGLYERCPGLSVLTSVLRNSRSRRLQSIRENLHHTRGQCRCLSLQGNRTRESAF